jgi:hypothetical protein
VDGVIGAADFRLSASEIEEISKRSRVASGGAG